MLSEKPIANDIAAAEKLIHFYTALKEKGSKATWGVAENFRFLAPLQFARKEIEKMGGVLGFRIKVFQHVKAGTKYFGLFIPPLPGDDSPRREGLVIEAIFTDSS